MNNVISCLEARGFIDAVTSEELKKKADQPLKVYLGFDPTAKSLHLGNFMGIMALGWFQRFGHTPVILIGGATAKIGDPSGKDKERPLLDAAEIDENVTAISRQISRIVDFEHEKAKPVLLNNDEWLADFPLIAFLRDVGKHFRMGPMLSKDSVKTRLASEEGMSFTEFTYQMLQGYDYYHLHTEHGVTLQIGGSDQWGNIVAGIELTRKLAQASVYGLTWPLLTRSDGKKFGKSESGAIWLDPLLCTPYQFYQYLVKIPDQDVGKMMRLLTFMDLEEIEEYEKRELAPNEGQKRLAAEVTKLLHGEEGLATALKVTEGAGPGKEAKLDGETLRQIMDDLPTATLSQEEIEGIKYPDLAVKAGLLQSKGEASRLIKNGGAYLNNQKWEDPSLSIDKSFFIDGEFILLGAGKKKKLLVKIAR